MIQRMKRMIEALCARVLKRAVGKEIVLDEIIMDGHGAEKVRKEIKCPVCGWDVRDSNKYEFYKEEIDRLIDMVEHYPITLSTIAAVCEIATSQVEMTEASVRKPVETIRTTMQINRTIMETIRNERFKRDGFKKKDQ